jgi:hypothetical protein
LVLTGSRLPGLLANGVRLRRDLDLSGSNVAGAHWTSASTGALPDSPHLASHTGSNSSPQLDVCGDGQVRCFSWLLSSIFVLSLTRLSRS